MTKSVETQDISAAADQLRDTITSKLGVLADELLGRPEIGSSEWIAQRTAMKDDLDARMAWNLQWHMTKLAIAREAGIDPTGDAINARHYGATWAQIGAACGVTRQAAYDRWSKHV